MKPEWYFYRFPEADTAKKRRALIRAYNIVALCMGMIYQEELPT